MNLKKKYMDKFDTYTISNNMWEGAAIDGQSRHIKLHIWIKPINPVK